MVPRRHVTAAPRHRSGHSCEDWPAAWPGVGALPAAEPCVERYQDRQMSRCTGISLGMSRRPGMNGMSSNRMVQIPVSRTAQMSTLAASEVLNGGTWYQSWKSQSQG